LVGSRTLARNHRKVKGTRGADTADAYFINWNGLLSRATWPTGAPWPQFVVESFETAPSLLPGSALAGCAAGQDYLVVGVGSNLRLRAVSFVQGSGWGTLVAIGQPQDLIASHGPLAAHAITDTTVMVAALTDAGQVATYMFQRADGTYTAAARQLVPDPPALSGAVPTTRELVATNGFRVNPFGDLALVHDARLTPRVLAIASTVCSRESYSWRASRTLSGVIARGRPPSRPRARAQRGRPAFAP
jgi:hypothetical protein